MNREPSIWEMKRAYQAQQQRQRTGRPTCHRCGREIVFVRSAKSTSKIPCDPKIIYGDGEKTLVTLLGEMIPKAPPKVYGREPHFGTCSHYQALRNAKKQRLERDSSCTIHQLPQHRP